MSAQINPHFVSLVQEATLKSFWRKRALRQFLRMCGITDSFLATWSSDEPKREFLYRLFDVLGKNRAGPSTILRVARNLCEQKSFPDLEGWEDSALKLSSAKKAVDELSVLLRSYENEKDEEKERIASRKRLAMIREERLARENDLARLSDRLSSLASEIGTSPAGLAFETWFFDLADYFEIESRRPYKVAGRQIDGSITIESTTYLVELKFTAEQAGAPDIDVFLSKVVKKADNTMGIMVSISGYSYVAVQEASSARTPLLLLDHNHIYAMLSATYTLSDIVRRIRRHASQTGQAFLKVEDFGG